MMSCGDRCLQYTFQVRRRRNSSRRLAHFLTHWVCKMISNQLLDFL